VTGPEFEMLAYLLGDRDLPFSRKSTSGHLLTRLESPYLIVRHAGLARSPAWLSGVR
jgi:hypothetical protein